MLDRLQVILDKVDRSRVQFVDMRIYESTQLSLTTRKGQAENVTSQKLDGIGIRALVNGAFGFASIASFDPVEVENTLQAAIKMAKGASETIKNKNTMDSESVFEANYELDFKNDVNPADLSFEEKMELSQRTETLLREHDHRIINSFGSYSEKIQKEQVINTNGTRVVSDYGVFRLTGSATARSGDIIQNVNDGVATNA